MWNHWKHIASTSLKHYTLNHVCFILKRTTVGRMGGLTASTAGPQQGYELARTWIRVQTKQKCVWFQKNFNVSLEDWMNLEAKTVFALVSELNRWSEITGTCCQEYRSLSDPLLYLLFALDYTSPAAQGFLLQEDTTNCSRNWQKRKYSCIPKRIAIPVGKVSSKTVVVNCVSVQLWLWM